MAQNEKEQVFQEIIKSSNTDSISIKDIQKLTVGELIEHYAYSQAIVETIREPLVVLDKSLRVKTANQSFYSTFKVSKDATEGCYIYELGNKQWDIPELKKLLERILKKNSFISDFKVTHLFEDIGQKTMLLNARRITFEGHRTHLILLAIEDITQRETTEQQKDDFLSIVSHELKTPLTSLQAYIQIVRKHLDKSDYDKDVYLLKNAETQVSRLSTLLNELLQLGKLESGKFDLDKKSFDIDELVTKVITDFSYSIPTHSITKTGAVSEHVYGDSNRIEQVITNLLSNAIKYSPDANKVEVYITNDDQQATISIRDYGIGIGTNDLPRVFDRYYRSNDTGENHLTGFGLGLYISSEIIKRHQGSIWAESKKGKGSTFRFTLPLVTKE